VDWTLALHIALGYFSRAKLESRDNAMQTPPRTYDIRNRLLDELIRRVQRLPKDCAVEIINYSERRESTKLSGGEHHPAGRVVVKWPVRKLRRSYW
jgi:hypothetical protein